MNRLNKFDTNILRKDRYNLNMLIEEYHDIGELYLADVVLYEIVEFYSAIYGT